MPRLVAIAMPGGPSFVEAVISTWDRGDAVAPLDPRAPAAHRDDVLGILAPEALIGADGNEVPLDGGRPVEDGDALVITTSGTSGVPRAVVLTHDAVRAAAFTTATRVGLDPGTRWLACLPLHHIGGFGVVSRALVTKSELEVHPGFDPDAVDDAARRGATHVSLVPTSLSRVDTQRFRTILLGGSAIPEDRPPNSIATYGMTETCGGVVYDGLALNGVGLRVDDTARIWLSGPTLLRAYRDGHDPKDDNGWLRTSDLGSVDPTTGSLTVWGRADDMIVTGGEKVWPATVEAVLGEGHDVRDVAVVGRSDPEWGERVVALVVPFDDRPPPSLDDLRARVKDRLPAYFAPKELEMVDSIPRTALGKVGRAALRQAEQQRAEAQHGTAMRGR
ncbi:MAG TPA: AMP-binding protein [Microthrixaceae bacterium]|nr:AMP-binding protein [Microthrixaceae bacterium]